MLLILRVVGVNCGIGNNFLKVFVEELWDVMVIVWFKICIEKDLMVVEFEKVGVRFLELDYFDEVIIFWVVVLYGVDWFFDFFINVGGFLFYLKLW